MLFSPNASQSFQSVLSNTGAHEREYASNQSDEDSLETLPLSKLVRVFEFNCLVLGDFSSIRVIFFLYP